MPNLKPLPDLILAAIKVQPGVYKQFLVDEGTVHCEALLTTECEQYIFVPGILGLPHVPFYMVKIYNAGWQCWCSACWEQLPEGELW